MVGGGELKALLDPLTRRETPPRLAPGQISDHWERREFLHQYLFRQHFGNLRGRFNAVKIAPFVFGNRIHFSEDKDRTILAEVHVACSSPSQLNGIRTYGRQPAQCAILLAFSCRWEGYRRTWLSVFSPSRVSVISLSTCWRSSDVSACTTTSLACFKTICKRTHIKQKQQTRSQYAHHT